jgi:hypothetical protein
MTRGKLRLSQPYLTVPFDDVAEQQALISGWIAVGDYVKEIEQHRRLENLWTILRPNGEWR